MSDAEHGWANEGPVTVVFTDVEGSTGLQASRGDTAARKLVGACEAIVRGQVEAHGGWVVKTLGDGVMAAFASPRRAIVAVLEANRELGRQDGERLRLRAGIHTGEVIVADDDIHGGAVSAAARICARAEGGEILVSDVVRQLCGTVAEVSFQDRGKVTLKGFSERWALFRVAPAADERALGRGETPFVGRDGARSDLRELLERTAGGFGSIVMIGGEPGVGKTRLASELAAEARQRGVGVNVGHCSEQGDLPYMPWVEMLEAAARTMPPRTMLKRFGEHAPVLVQMAPELRAALPDLPPVPDLPPDQQRWYLFNGVRGYLTSIAKDRPQLLILDDLHWADDSTLQLLEHAAGWVAEVPLMIVCTHRDTPSEIAPRFAATLSALARSPHARLETLSRLSLEEVHAMVSVLAERQPPVEVTRAIFAESDGNAFFVQEIFRHLAESGRLFDEDGDFRADLSIADLDAPANVRIVLGERLGRLDHRTLELLGTAAVIGRGFAYSTLATLNSNGREQLVTSIEEAEAAQLIEEVEFGSDIVYRFSHELIRQTLLSGLSAPRRQLLHLRVADALEAEAGGDADRRAADIAGHLLGAGVNADPRRTAAYLIRAGERSQSAAAFEEALRAYEQALALLGPAADRDRAALLLKMGIAHRSLRSWDRAIALWNEAIDILAELGDVDDAAEQCWELSQQLSWNYRFQEMGAVLSRGLAALGDRPSPHRPRLLGMTGLLLGITGQHAAADAHIERARTLAESASDPQVAAQVWLIETIHHYFHMRFPEATNVGRLATRRLRELGSVWSLADALAFTSVAVTFQGLFEESELLTGEAGTLTRRLGHWAAASSAERSEFACAAARRADLEELGRLASGQLALARDTGADGWVAYAETLRGILWFWRGDWEAADRRLEEGVRLGMPFWHGGHHGFQLLVRAYRGLGADVHAALDSQRDHLPQPHSPNRLGDWTLAILAAEAAGVLDDAELGRMLYPMVREALATGAVMRQFDGRLIVTCAAMAAEAAGLAGESEQHFEAALRLANELPHELERPHAKHFAARFLLRRGGTEDTARAGELLLEAIEDYDLIGMPRHAALARELLAPAQLRAPA